MTIMDSALLLSILKDIIVPEISTYMYTKYAATGELPTQEELKDKIDEISARIIMKGENFLQQIQSDND
jgi:hypothetical protein